MCKWKALELMCEWKARDWQIDVPAKNMNLAAEEPSK